MPQLYIVIPNYNGEEHLVECLNSIRRQTIKDIKTIIVDNDSKDNSNKIIREIFPEIKLIELNFNSGFAAGVNTGIKEALKDLECSYILLLNNDIECKDDFVEKFKAALSSEESAGSAACKMMNYYKRDIIDDAGDFIKKKGSPYQRGSEEKDFGQYNKTEFIFGSCAGAALYKRNVFEKAGFFDEDFFAYYEDIDFSFRLQLMGIKCIFTPEAVCYHKKGGSFNKVSEFALYLRERNVFSMRMKDYPLKLLILYSPYFFFRRFYRIFKVYKETSPSAAKALTKGYIHGLLRIPSILKKRAEVQKTKTVSTEYIEGMFT